MAGNGHGPMGAYRRATPKMSPGKVFPIVFLSPRVRTLLGCDIALLVGRLMLGVVLFAHGWQKLVIKGIGGTYAWFQAMGIPLAIVATSFVTVVEFVGGALLLLGALTRVVVALHILVMIGAAAFVHVSHGLFAQDGGWELVGVIAACELVLAATGAGRFSIDHLVHRGRQARAIPPTTAASSPAPGGCASRPGPRMHLSCPSRGRCK